MEEPCQHKAGTHRTMCRVFRVTWEGGPDSSLGLKMSQIVYFCLQTNSWDMWDGNLSIPFCILGGG